MPQVFGKRFGTDEEGFKTFENWADAYCEFLILDKEPASVVSAKDESHWASNFATALICELETLPQNKYINMLKDIVEQWTLM